MLPVLMGVGRWSEKECHPPPSQTPFLKLRARNSDDRDELLKRRQSWRTRPWRRTSGRLSDLRDQCPRRLVMRTRRALIAVSLVVPALALARWATGRMRPDDPVTTDVAIRFGEVAGRELLLDVYSPPQRERFRPAVLLIHGGGFVGGSRADADI